jgi:hypothetical protein
MILIFSILFIIKDIFYLKNKKRIESLSLVNSKASFFYYLLTLIYPIWLIFGLFTEYHLLFYILLGLVIIKFPIYHINDKLYFYYKATSPIISLFLLVIIGVKSIH